MPELTTEQVKEFQAVMAEVKGGWAAVKDLPETVKILDTRVKTLETENTTLKASNDDLKRKLLARSTPLIIEPRRPGQVTTDCARYLGAITLLAASAHGKSVKPEILAWSRKHVIEVIERMGESEPVHRALGAYAAQVKATPENGVIQKTALTTSDIPLPTGYSGQIVELVEEYGSFRRYATVFPMGEATVNLPKLGTDPVFGFIDMSEAVPEKSPTFTNVEFAAKKAGGLVRIPTELEEDSIVALGQFIARYVARQIASWEDKTGWLADASATYKTLSGVVKRVVANSKTKTLGAGLTASEDVTLAGLRSIRPLVHSAALQVGAYYLHGSMESVLVTFNTNANGVVYVSQGPNGATLDGFPIRWINKLPVNADTAIASTVVACFGDMSFWYMGVRGGVRIDTDLSVFFANDQIAVRALERFTVNEMATDHMSGLVTAAS